MSATNISEADICGQNDGFSYEVQRLHEVYGFDFVAVGLTAYVGAPLRWIYSAGASGERYKRIALAPGHGIGGIVIKTGKPMLFTDIDHELDPREYSSFPIVFAEDLRSFAAYPLAKEGKTVGVLLCAFRSVSPSHIDVFEKCVNDSEGDLCGLTLIGEGFLNFSKTAEALNEVDSEDFFPHPELTQIIAAQENERKRLSRELHDGTIQELLSVSFSLRELESSLEEGEKRALCRGTAEHINRILDKLRNMSIELRPSSLDHFGLAPALRAQADIFEKEYGVEVIIRDNLGEKRFHQALETQVFRICQEAILNSCKYSGTELIVVDIEEDQEQLRACITDFGKGFDVNNPPILGSGCGLLGMQERAYSVGARLEIKSGREGTRILMVTPLELRRENNR